ncbi:MAG: hypothetical protein ACRCVN_05895 [Spirochaetia bacterium]
MKVVSKTKEGYGWKYEIVGKKDFEVGEDLDFVGTGAQNKFFHKLLGVVYPTKAWVGAFHSMSGDEQDRMTLYGFRHLVKIEIGCKIDYYMVVTESGIAELLKNCPSAKDYRLVAPHPTSWAKYTKKERMETIERFFAWVEPMGIDDVLEPFRRDYFNDAGGCV